MHIEEWDLYRWRVVHLIMGYAVVHGSVLWTGSQAVQAARAGVTGWIMLATGIADTGLSIWAVGALWRIHQTR